MTQKEREIVTVQLLHTALEDIFYSVPEVPNARMESLLEPYVDAFQLTMMLSSNLLITPPKSMEITRMYINGEGLGAVTNIRRENVAVLRSTQYLLGMAFEDCYNRFADTIYAMVENGVKETKNVFNRYATIALEPHITHRGQVQALELKIGEDIRFIHYRKSFPNKRYRPSGHDRSHRLDGISTDLE